MDKHQIEISARICPSFKTSPGVLVNGSQQIIAGNYLFSYPKHVIQGSEQKIAYKALINRLLSAFRDGYNCTLLAYGQTGSGKTYSMFGPTGSLTESSLAQSNEGIPEDWGVLPRTMLNILNENSSFGTMYVSAIEVYVNTAYDLLNGRCALKVGGTRTKEAPHYAGVDKHGDVEVHPSYCDCHKCFVRKNKVKNSNNFERQSSKFLGLLSYKILTILNKIPIQFVYITRYKFGYSNELCAQVCVLYRVFLFTRKRNMLI